MLTFACLKGNVYNIKHERVQNKILIKTVNIFGFHSQAKNEKKCGGTVLS